MILKGFAAIEYAEKASMKLNKAADRVDEAVHGLTVAEAEAIASEDPNLIWLEVPDNEYYEGAPITMEPER